MIKDILSACQNYATEDNSDANGKVMKVTLSKDYDGRCLYTDKVWPEGAPVCKMFDRNNAIPVFIPAGTEVMGVQYTGRASGDEVYEFVFRQTWYRTYVHDGNCFPTGDRLEEVV